MLRFLSPLASNLKPEPFLIFLTHLFDDLSLSRKQGEESGAQFSGIGPGQLFDIQNRMLP